MISMKRLVLSIVLIGITGGIFAQTNFRSISYQEGLKVAENEKKLLFVDFYTETCGPCKQMMRDIFPQKEVGDFMEKHFVCLKINAKKGEGVELSKRFKVRAYPTCLIIRPDGQVQHCMLGAPGDAESFINLVKRGLKKKTSLLYLENRYASGKMSKKELDVYYDVLQSILELKKAQKINEERIQKSVRD